MRVMELHTRVSVIQRSKGRTATAAAAYRSGSQIECERTGQVHDYRRKQGVEDTALLLPAAAPGWACDRQELWNRAELRENHPRAQTAREIELSFPCEFSCRQRKEAGLQIGQMIVDRYGVAADLTWHWPSRKGDDRNFHLHILFTTRRFENGTWSKTKDRILDDLNKGPQEIAQLRAAVAGIFNTIAARDRLQVHVEHRSFEARGIDREPTQHTGPIATQMERRGSRSDIGNKNRAITVRNQHRQALYEKRKVVDAAIARERVRLNQLVVLPPAPQSTHRVIARRMAPAQIEPARPRGSSRRSGPSSLGELYEYYRRMGMLEVFFALFPRQ